MWSTMEIDAFLSLPTCSSGCRQFLVVMNATTVVMFVSVAWEEKNFRFFVGQQSAVDYVCVSDGSRVRSSLENLTRERLLFHV